MNKSFKTCTNCSHHWESLIDFIRDTNLEINGYQAAFNDAHEGLFLFTHNVAGCGTTLAIPAGSLRSLYNGPEHTIHMAFTERCDGHCMYEDDLESCSNACDMKWARDILLILRNHGPESLLKRMEQTGSQDVRTTRFILDYSARP